MTPRASKQIYVAMVIAMFATALALILMGCSGFGPVQQKTITLQPPHTNYIIVTATRTNSVVTTNAVVKIVEGKQVSVLVPVTNHVVTVETNTVPVVIPAVTYQSNYLAAPWEAAVTTVGAVAPLPWSGVVTTGLLALTTTVLGYLNRRNAMKAQTHLSALGEITIVAETLVDNFETLRKAALEIPAYKSSLDPKIMDAVKLAQRVAGVKNHIDKLVDERTENTL